MSEREMIPLTTSLSSTTTSRWTWGGGHSEELRGCRDPSPPHDPPAPQDSYLSLNQTVDDGFQRLVLVTLEDTLKVVGAVLQRPCHRHIQVVVGLLSCQVLGQGQALGTQLGLGDPHHPTASPQPRILPHQYSQ